MMVLNVIGIVWYHNNFRAVVEAEGNFVRISSVRTWESFIRSDRDLVDLL